MNACPVVLGSILKSRVSYYRRVTRLSLALCQALTHAAFRLQLRRRRQGKGMRALLPDSE